MSIWQTQKWQEMLKKSWQTSDFFVVDNVYIEKRSIGLWFFWLFILWIKWKINNSTFDKIVELSKEQNAVFIQIENISYACELDFWQNKFFKSGSYKKFITPYTAIIDLELSLDEILKKMKPKWRYNIKLAEKKWVEVLDVEKNDKNIKLFFDLMNETTSRDWFNWNSFEYYKIFLNELNNSKLILAYKEEKVIWAWIFVYQDDFAIYYYWASTSDKKYRNLMAPYLLQWEAIKIWKENKCKYYDFLWVSTPWEKKSSLSWVTDFKLKLTPDIIKVSDSYIYINKKIIYLLFVLKKKFK